MMSRAKWGLFVVLVSAALLTFLTAARQGWLTPHDMLRIELQSNPALAPGVPVKVKGFEIGHVSDVALNDAGVVQVEMQIARRYMSFIAKDAKLRLKREGFIGPQYLEFTDGTVTERASKGDLMAFDAGTDWMAKAESLEPVIRQILANTETVTGKLAPMMDTVQTTLVKAQPDALQLLKSGRKAGENAADMMSDLRGSGIYRMIAPSPTPVETGLDPYEDRLAR